MGANLITPAHTLNEQSYTIPANTYASNAELAQGITEFLAERFGWPIVDGKPVAVRSGKISVYASMSNTVSLYAKNAVISEVRAEGSTIYTYQTTIYWHVSSDEKTMYLSLKGGTNIVTASLVLAENAAGNVSVFISASFGTGFSENSAATVKALPTSSNNGSLVDNDLYYSVSKFPDFFNGSEFASLYRLNSARIAGVRNQIVVFGEQYFRLVYADYLNSTSTGIPWFAFPVEDRPIVRKRFSECTLAEISSMLRDHYDGAFNIGDYWQAGDTATVRLSAISATADIDESYAAQDIGLEIVGLDHNLLQTPLNGHTKAGITVRLVGVPGSEGVYIWGRTAALGNDQVWSNSPRRAWLNTTFKNALPEAIRNLIKPVVKVCQKYHDPNEYEEKTETVVDSVSMSSEYEIYGEMFSALREGEQYELFRNDPARITAGDVFNERPAARAYAWTRTPDVTFYAGGGYSWAYVFDENESKPNLADKRHGLAIEFSM